MLEDLKTMAELSEKMKLLKKYDSWIILSDFLRKGKIESLREKLLNGEYKTLEERNRDKDKLEAYESLLSAPDLLIRAKDEEDEENADPYEGAKI